jgi:hypothetical protein
MSNADLKVIHFADTASEDARSLFALPVGVEVKVLRHVSEDDDRRDFIARFPPGYVEPEHTNGGGHISVVLEGKQIVGDEVLGPADYLFGPRDLPHDPFEYPEGRVLFVSTRGDTTHHW